MKQRRPLRPGDKIRPCHNAGGYELGDRCNWAYLSPPARVVHVEAGRVDYERFPFRAIYSTRSWVRVP